jgi:hypothetical protein
MSFNSYTTDFFDKELKRLSREYLSVKNDYKALVDSLKEEPKQGQPLGLLYTSYGYYFQG